MKLVLMAFVMTLSSAATFAQASVSITNIINESKPDILDYFTDDIEGVFGSSGGSFTLEGMPLSQRKFIFMIRNDQMGGEKIAGMRVRGRNIILKESNSRPLKFGEDIVYKGSGYTAILNINFDEVTREEVGTLEIITGKTKNKYRVHGNYQDSFGE